MTKLNFETIELNVDWFHRELIEWQFSFRYDEESDIPVLNIQRAG